MSEIRLRHKLAATAAAVAVHAGLLVLFWEPGSSNAAGVDTGGIEIGLALAGGPVGPVAPVQDVAEAEQVEAVEETAAVQPPDMVEAVTPAETVEAAEPVEPVETVEVVEAAEPVEAVEPAEPPPASVAETVQQVVEAPPPRRRPEAAPPAPAPVSTPAPQPQVAALAPPPGGASPGGSGSAGGGGSSRDEVLLYRTRLQALLTSQRRYPHRAQRRGMEGEAHLRFVLDDGGRVVSYAIVRSTGYEVLDEEVVAALERAQPLPPPPPGMERTIEVSMIFAITD